MRQEVFERCEGLVLIPEIKQIEASLTMILLDLRDEGFSEIDISDYMKVKYHKIIGEVFSDNPISDSPQFKCPYCYTPKWRSHGSCGSCGRLGDIQFIPISGPKEDLQKLEEKLKEVLHSPFVKHAVGCAPGICPMCKLLDCLALVHKEKAKEFKERASYHHPGTEKTGHPTTECKDRRCNYVSGSR